jgi:hypothetical protein
VTERIEFWGAADDGTLACIRIGSLLADEVERNDHGDPIPGWWWPPLGLLALAEPPADAGDPVLFDSAGGWHRLESDLGLFTAERLAGYVAVHAAVLRLDDQVVILPGPSYAGKSSLCLAALAEGHEVLSDEYALVDPLTGDVAGWPRQLRLRQPGGGVTRVHPGGTLIGTTPATPVPVDLVAVVAYCDEVTAPLAVDQVPGSELVLGILANTVCAASRPTEAFVAAVSLARHAPGVVGQRGEAADAIGELAGLAARLPRPDPAEVLRSTDD